MAYVYEFLYRGRDATHEAGKLPAWHVRLAEWVAGPDGVAKCLESDALTPDAALKAGYTLDAILTEITVAAIADADRARVERDAARTERDHERAERAAALKERDDMARIIEVMGAQVDAVAAPVKTKAAAKK